MRGTIVALHRPRVDDRREFLAAARASRDLHGDWVHPPLTTGAFAEFLRRARAADRSTFLARARRDQRLVGVVNVSNIIGGSFANATLGYYGFAEATGSGRMTEAVRLAVEHCFVNLGLHRVEANIQPANARSRALVTRLGFRHEGHSPRLLEIGGEWRDHDRYAITVEEWPRH
jgi:ribosomal-protein-alanine N-acetyltransferase